jgi:prepilin-type N-terminal cleavage/methylation domain-containing protein
MRERFSLSGISLKRRASGFTLIELVISIVLLGILAVVGSNMMSDSFTTTRIVNASNVNAGQARYAVERLVRELREVKYASSSTNPKTYCDSGNTVTDQYCFGTLPSGSATSFSMTFVKTVAGANVTVTINYSNPPTLNLQYSTSSGTGTLSTAAAAFSLKFLDETGSATTDLKKYTAPSTTTTGIRYVVITLNVPNTNAASPQTILQRTTVALRN